MLLELELYFSSPIARGLKGYKDCADNINHTQDKETIFQNQSELA